MKFEKGYTLFELSRLCGGYVKGDGSVMIWGIGPVEEAEEGEITFVLSKQYLPKEIRASAVVTNPKMANHLKDLPLIISDFPKAVFAKIANLFVKTLSPLSGIHESAIIEKSAVIGVDVYIGPMVYVGKKAVIGDRTILMAKAYVGNDVKIGKDCIIHPGAIILDNSILGDRVIIHSGAVIGSDGFGYAQDEMGNHIKIPQVGRVVIEDDVEIGANSTVDRATFGETRIKRGTKIDNLVMVAHNVVIGERSILAGQVGIAGSSIVGNNVIMAGQVGVADHVKIGNNVKIGPKSGVPKDIGSDMEVIGIPAMPKEEYFRLYWKILRLIRPKRKQEG